MGAFNLNNDCLNNNTCDFYVFVSDIWFTKDDMSPEGADYVNFAISYMTSENLQIDSSIPIGNWQLSFDFCIPGLLGSAGDRRINSLVVDRVRNPFDYDWGYVYNFTNHGPDTWQAPHPNYYLTQDGICASATISGIAHDVGGAGWSLLESGVLAEVRTKYKGTGVDIVDYPEGTFPWWQPSYGDQWAIGAHSAVTNWCNDSTGYCDGGGRGSSFQCGAISEPNNGEYCDTTYTPSPQYDEDCTGCPPVENEALNEIARMSARNKNCLEGNFDCLSSPWSRSPQGGREWEANGWGPSHPSGFSGNNFTFDIVRHDSCCTGPDDSDCNGICSSYFKTGNGLLTCEGSGEICIAEGESCDDGSTCVGGDYLDRWTFLPTEWCHAAGGCGLPGCSNSRQPECLNLDNWGNLFGCKDECACNYSPDSPETDNSLCQYADDIGVLLYYDQDGDGVGGSTSRMWCPSGSTCNPTCTQCGPSGYLPPCPGGGQAGWCANTGDVDDNCFSNSFDCAGICDGDTTFDCNGDCGGSAYTDNCGDCVGGNTGLTACTQDCEGTWGGNASYDNCGVCEGANCQVTNTTCPGQSGVHGGNIGGCGGSHSTCSYLCLKWLRGWTGVGETGWHGSIARRCNGSDGCNTYSYSLVSWNEGHCSCVSGYSWACANWNCTCEGSSQGNQGTHNVSTCDAGDGSGTDWAVDGNWERCNYRSEAECATNSTESGGGWGTRWSDCYGTVDWSGNWNGCYPTGQDGENSDMSYWENNYIVSDRKYKKNIELVGKSPSGLNIYEFEYKDKKYGEGRFRGVMAEEIPEEAKKEIDGIMMVNYNLLDVEFKSVVKLW
tara:strand:- start:712 stop:3207 length:2496 start_codon:yes stop_codon:yes gene_type:complete